MGIKAEFAYVQFWNLSKKWSKIKALRERTRVLFHSSETELTPEKFTWKKKRKHTCT